MSTLSLEFSIKDLEGHSVLVASLHNPDNIPDSDIRMGWAKKGLGIAQALMSSGKAFPMRVGANGPQSASLRFLDIADTEEDICIDCEEAIDDCMCDDLESEYDDDFENDDTEQEAASDEFGIGSIASDDFDISEDAEAEVDSSLIAGDPELQAVIDRFVTPPTDSCIGFTMELVAGRDSYSDFGGMACPTIALATSVAVELRAMAQ